MLVVCLERIDAADLPGECRGELRIGPVHLHDDRQPTASRPERVPFKQMVDFADLFGDPLLVKFEHRLQLHEVLEHLVERVHVLHVRRLVADHPWFELLQVFPEVPLVLHLGAHSFVA